jgi:hypothetical protein
MAKKVVASLRDTSGVKYAKLIQSVKSKKTGSYVFKEEIIMEDHVKDILAGKSQQDIIRELRVKEKEAEAAKQAKSAEQAPAAEAPKEEDPKQDTAPAAEAPKEEAPKQDTAPSAEAAPKEEAPKQDTGPAAETPKEEEKK